MWELLLVGLIITLEPLPIAAFTLVLSTENGTRKGLGFLFGWVACLVAIILLTVGATGGDPPASQSVPARIASVAVIAIGGLLLVVAARRRRKIKLGPSAPKPPPSWVAKVDTMSVWAAASLGVLLQPWPFVAAGAALVVEADTSSAQSIAYLVLFCLVASASLLTMEIYMIVAHDAAIDRLTALRQWIEGHRDLVIEILALIGGIALIAKGVYQLVA